MGASRCLFLEGVVRRLRQVPPQLRQTDPIGFGVAFRSPGEVVEELLPSSGHANRLEVRFSDPPRLLDAWLRELRVGGLFVCTEKQLARDAEVQVEVHLDWLGRSFEFQGKVVQSVLTPGASGVAIAFQEPSVVRVALGPFVGK
ncbi:MAG: hypothetical protein HY901_16075, partial [Deltaproteobacteria bacterium]|nr:hypothetical protein [Deltaproteobacteria bacterium]